MRLVSVRVIVYVVLYWIWYRVYKDGEFERCLMVEIIAQSWSPLGRKLIGFLKAQGASFLTPVQILS